MVASFFQNIGRSFRDDIRGINADSAGQPFRGIADRYTTNELYYDNEMYQLLNGVVAAAKARSGLYRNIRPIRNPMRRAVDWYPGHLYPGAMTPDGLALPDGTPSCIPFAEDTDPELRLAMTQALVWANWGAERWAFGRQLAMLGDAFGEVHVDYERAKVHPRLHHPKFVTDAEWNGSGDLVMYRLDVPQFDEQRNKSYVWGKVVTKETVTTLRDGKPAGYDGQPAELPNPWGFCPAAWCQFRNVGGQHGASVIDGVRGKIDELNSSLSSIHDYIGKFAAQGVIFKTKASVADIVAFTPGVSTNELANPQAGRQEIRYLKGPPDLEVDKLLENLGLADAVAYVEQQVREIESDLPESTFADKIREHPQIAGVALRMMFPDVEPRLFEAEGNADAFLVKLMQMSVSIGGELARSGEWGLRSRLTEAQQKFLPYSSESYDRGELDVSLLPRPLFPETQAERIASALGIESLKTATGMAIAGLPPEAIYGPLADGQTEYPKPSGLLAEQSNGVGSVADVLGRAFNAGQVAP